MLQVKNLAYSTLAADITDVATSLTVATNDGARFPSTFPFHLSLDVEASREIVRCTARTTDTMTIARAQEGTTGIAHSAGVGVRLAITAGVIQENCPLVVRKTADEIVNNSEVYQNDDELFFLIGANEVWEVTVLFIQISSSIAGFARRLVGPSGASGFTYQVTEDSNYNIVVIRSPLGTGAETCGYEEDILEILHAIVKNGATPGNVQFQWCQGNPEVSDTIVRANSCIIAHRLA